METVKVNPELCTGCGACVDVCPNEALKLEDGKVSLVGDCMACFACVSVCPSGALENPWTAGPRQGPEAKRAGHDMFGDADKNLQDNKPLNSERARAAEHLPGWRGGAVNGRGMASGMLDTISKATGMLLGAWEYGRGRGKGGRRGGHRGGRGGGRGMGRGRGRGW